MDRKDLIDVKGFIQKAHATHAFLPLGINTLREQHEALDTGVTAQNKSQSSQVLEQHLLQLG